MKRPLVWVAIAYLTTLGVVSCFFGEPFKAFLALLLLVSFVGAFYRRKPMAYMLAGVLIGVGVIVPHYSNYISIKSTVGKQGDMLLSVDDVYEYSESFGILKGYGVLSFDDGTSYKTKINLSSNEPYTTVKGDTISAKVVVTQVLEYWESAGNAYITVKPTDKIIKSSKDLLPIKGFFLRLNNKLVQQSYKIMPAETASIINAMTFGNGSGISDENKSALNKSALSHIVVVSGQHLMVVGSILSVLWGSKRSRLGVIATIIFGWAFTAFTGFSPSIVRGALMFTVAQLALFGSRRTDSISSLCLAVIFMTALDPTVLRSLSLILSATAVLGIGTVGSGSGKFLIEQYTKRFGEPADSAKGTILTLSTIFGAQMGTLPALIYINGSLASYGIFSNIVVIPLVMPTMVIGFLTVVTSYFWSGGGAFFAVISKGLVGILLKTARLFSSLPYATLRFNERFQVIWLFCVIVFVALNMFYDIKRRHKNIILMGLVIGIILPTLVFLGLNRGTVDVYTFKHINTVIYSRGNRGLVVGLPQDKDDVKIILNTLEHSNIGVLDYIVDVTDAPSDYALQKLIWNSDVKNIVTNYSITTQAIADAKNINVMEKGSIKEVDFAGNTYNIDFTLEDFSNKAFLFDKRILEKQDLTVIRLLTWLPQVEKYRIKMR